MNSNENQATPPSDSFGCAIFSLYLLTDIVIGLLLYYNPTGQILDMLWMAPGVVGALFLLLYNKGAMALISGFWTFAISALYLLLYPFAMNNWITFGCLLPISQIAMFFSLVIISDTFEALDILSRPDNKWTGNYKSFLSKRDLFFSRWLRYDAARVLVELKTPEAAQVLAQAFLETDDSEIRSVAHRAVERLTDPRLIDATCAVWERTRDPRLGEILERKKWIAESPLELKILTALALNRLDKAKENKTESIRPLLKWANDADARIASNAAQALSELTDEESREEICRVVLESDHAHARALALEKGFAPADEKNRAYFFFLTEQWDRYDKLDFDRKIMRDIYDSEKEDARQRIRERIKRLGRMDILPIITGASIEIENEDLSADEYGALAQTLIANRDWERLWQHVDEFPFLWSVRTICAMKQNDWQPREKNDRALFDELVGYAQNKLETAGEKDLSELFPPAVINIQARGKGSFSQINDFAFSMLRPSIALATHSGDIILWNYAKAKRERLLKGLSPSIGRVLLTDEDALLCSNSSALRTRDASIYGWKDPWGNPISFQLKKGQDSEIEIALTGRAQVLSVDGSGNVALWDVDTQKEIASRFLSGAKAEHKICVSPGGASAILYGEVVRLVGLPDLQEYARITATDTLQSATFSLDGRRLIAGTKNGKALLYTIKHSEDNYSIKEEKEPLTEFNAGLEKVVAVARLKDLPVAIAAGSGGKARFISTEDRTLLGSISSPKGQIRLARLNQDETLLGILETGDSFSIWDLRPLAIRMKINEPLRRFDSSSMKPLNGLLQQEELVPRIRAALSFLRCLLQRRFQYEMEIDETPPLPSGEFDIDIERE